MPDDKPYSIDTELDELIADRIVEVMNDALKRDPEAIHALVELRVPCNKALADHPTIQILAAIDPEPSTPEPLSSYSVGLLGILNGLAGTQVYKNTHGWGRVESVFQVCCGECGKLDKESLALVKTKNLVVGDLCPACGRTLVLGPLECFRRVRGE